MTNECIGLAFPKRLGSHINRVASFGIEYTHGCVRSIEAYTCQLSTHMVKAHIHMMSRIAFEHITTALNFLIYKLDLLWLWWLQHKCTRSWYVWTIHPWSCWNHCDTQKICKTYFYVFFFLDEIIGIPMSSYCIYIITKQRLTNP